MYIAALMDDIGSTGGSLSETPGGSNLDRDVELHLAGYLNSVPYKCESNEVMQQKLQFVVGRIVLCAQSRDWKSLSTWIGVFQWSALLASSPALRLNTEAAGWHSNTRCQSL